MKKDWFVSLKMVAVTILMAVFLAGCSFLSAGLSGEDARAEFVLQAAVISGTSRLIDSDADRRDEVLKIANTIDDYLEKNPEGRAADVGLLLSENIPWDKLTQEEKLLTNGLIVLVTEEVKGQIEKGVVPADILVYLKTIVKWVKQTASVAYVEPGSVGGTAIGGGSSGVMAHEGHRDYPALAMFTAEQKGLGLGLPSAPGVAHALADKRPGI